LPVPLLKESKIFPMFLVFPEYLRKKYSEDFSRIYFASAKKLSKII
jgi:hypothetical protein